MTRIAIIGLGRVGSTTAFCLLKSSTITELILINKTKAITKGLKADLIATFPDKSNMIIEGEYKDANNADIILVTCGNFGAPEGMSLWDSNKEIIKDIFSQIRPKKDAKIIVITTPCDRTAKLVADLTKLPKNHILGFGGQLDVNRLKYLIYTDKGKNIPIKNVYFVGEHGKRGIPIFDEKIKNRKELTEKTQKFFSLYLKEYAASTFGTANELAKLSNALLSEKKRTLCVSYYNKNQRLFVTWPCMINNKKVEPVKIDLKKNQKAYTKLINERKREEKI